MPTKFIGEATLDLRTIATPPTLSTPNGTVNALVYFDGTNLMASLGGAAYAPILIGSAGSVSLQTAYNTGRTIVVAAAQPVSIANSAAVTSDLLSLTEANLVTNGDVGVNWARRIAPAPAGQIFTGSAFKAVNAPIGTNNCTEQGVIVSITHQPVAGAGAITDTTVGLGIGMSPAAASAVVGETITMSTLATGQGLLITHNRATNGAGVISARFAGANQAVGLEFTDGQNVAVSAADEGRLIYNKLTQTFQVSMNMAAYTDIDTVAGASLQTAYNAGNQIVVTAGTPVRVTNADAVNSGLLTLVDIFKGSETGNILTVSRSVEPTAATTWSGKMIEVSNIPTNTNNSASTAHLIDVLHAPVAGAGTLTDTTTGIFVEMTPAASAAVVGINIQMDALCSATSTPFQVDYRGVASTNGIARVVTFGAATVLTGTTLGAVIDLATFVTTVAQVVIGAKILTCATTAADADGQAALVVDSQATAARVVDLAFGNTSGKILTLRYRQNTSAAGCTGINADFVTHTASDASDHTVLLGAVRAHNGADGTLGVSLTRSGAIGGASTYTGSSVKVNNTPSSSGGLTLTESGILVNILHTPVLNGGTVTDTTIGLGLTITPAASSTVFGVKITMGANTAASGAGIVFGTGAPATMFDILGASDKSLIIRSGAAQALSLNTPGGANLLLNADGSTTFLDGSSMVFGVGSGTQIGAAANQKIGFWGHAPVVQQSWTAAGGTAATLATALAAAGLIAIV